MRALSLGIGYSATAPTEKQGIGSPKYSIPTSRKGVVACHSSTGNAPTSFSQADWQNHSARLSDYFHYIAADLVNAQNWGTDAAQSRVADSWSYLQTTRGVPSSKTLLFALSMGALAALNWAFDNPTKVAAIALIIPITDLKDAHDNRGFSALIESAQAYGSHSAYLAAEPTHNPSATGRQAALAGIPIKLWYSTDDPAAVASVCLAWAASMNSQGGNVTTTSMGAVSHTASALDPEQVAEFLLAYA